MEKKKCYRLSRGWVMAGSDRCDSREPGEGLRVEIHRKDRDGRRLDATSSAERCALNNAAILRQVGALPLLAAKVGLAIHWQALKIWLRGGVFHRKPAPPRTPIS